MGKKITELTLDAAPASTDVVAIVDLSGPTTKKTTAAALVGAVAIPESQVTGLTADLAAKAPLASPALTGSPTAPTQAGGDSSTKIATTAFVAALATAVAAAGAVPKAGSNGNLASGWLRRLLATNTDTGTQNDWAPGIDGDTLVPWSGAADMTVTGLSGLATGAIWIFKNIGAKAAFFKHLNGGSSAAHQFTNLVTSGDTPVAPGGWICFYNDGTNLKLIAHEQGSWLTWSPAITPNTGTFTSITATPTIYKISGRSLEMIAAVTGTAGGSPVFFNLPNPLTFTFTDSLIAPMYIGANGSGVAEMGYCQTSVGKIIAVRLGNAVWGNGTATWYVNAKGDVD